MSERDLIDILEIEVSHFPFHSLKNEPSFIIISSVLSEETTAYK